MADLFNNNISNDYVNPNLPQCPGAPDAASFEFLPNQEVGVISGSNVLLSMSLGDLVQPVTGWTQETKLLQSGEVAYISGLTKAVSFKREVFPIDGSAAWSNINDPDYMTVDLSINYYRNFRYYEDISIHAISDVNTGIDIASAINIALGAKGIGATVAYAAYNSSIYAFTFTGSPAGYWYDITEIDVSRWNPTVGLTTPDPSTGVRASLTEDPSLAIPSAKYPNGGMLGYVLKVTYPTSVTADYLKYIELNHVPNSLVYFEPSTGDPNSYVRYDKDVDVGLSGASTSTTLSAADYLDYVQSNNKWDKVGVLRMWLAAEDPDNSSVTNLITGFYLFNPQTFPVEISYMIIL
jgi:hypothetical protein